MITRLDDDLHARLKSQAAAEGRSVNSLVVDALTAVTSQTNVSSGEGVRSAAARAGLLVVPTRPAKVPSRRTLARATEGAGRSVSEALEAERDAR